jgi:hypothetical protein
VSTSDAARLVNPMRSCNCPHQANRYERPSMLFIGSWRSWRHSKEKDGLARQWRQEYPPTPARKWIRARKQHLGIPLLCLRVSLHKQTPASTSGCDIDNPAAFAARCTLCQLSTSLPLPGKVSSRTKTHPTCSKPTLPSCSVSKQNLKIHSWV